MDRKSTKPTSKTKITAPSAPVAKLKSVETPVAVAPVTVAVAPVAAPKSIAIKASEAPAPAKATVSTAKPDLSLVKAAPKAVVAPSAPSPKAAVDAKKPEAASGFQALNARALTLCMDQGKGQLQLAKALASSKTPAEAFKLAQDFSQSQIKAWQSFSEAWLETLRQSGAGMFRA